MSGVDDIFGGYPSLKFPDRGTSWTITVEGVKKSQQTDFDTGEPLFWEDGNPREQLVITGRLDEADWDDDETDDDADAGMRRLFAKSGILKALGECLKAQKVKPSQMPGGVLTMTYTGDGPKPKRGNPPKVYQAEFVKGVPAASREVDDIDDDREDDKPARRSREKVGAGTRSGRRSGSTASDTRSNQHQAPDDDEPDF